MDNETRDYLLSDVDKTLNIETIREFIRHEKLVAVNGKEILQATVKRKDRFFSPR